MALPDLHLFVEDLKKKPGRGDYGPPRTIRAADLDENYKKVTLLESNEQPKAYTVEYTKEGTRITLGTQEFDVCENGQPVKYRMVATKV